LELKVSGDKTTFSEKVYCAFLIVLFALITVLILLYILPFQILVILLFPIFWGGFFYKNRHYLIFAILLGILGIITSYLTAPELFKSAVITILFLGVAFIPLMEVAIKYLKKVERYSEELKQSKRKFEQLLNYTYDWEYWIKPDGSLGYSSPSCFPQTGYEREEFLENKNLLSDIVHPDYREVWEEHLLELDSPEAKRLEFKILKKNGKTKVLRHTCQPVYDDEGNFIGRRATNRNATDRWIAEQKLKESERKYKYIFNSFPDVYYRTTLDGIVEVITPSIRNVSGYVAEELIGQNILKVYVEEKDRESFLNTLLEKGSVKNFQVRLRDKDGAIKYVSSNAKLIRDAEGKPIAIEGVIRDVTELKEKEEELRKAKEQAQKYLDIANVMIVFIDREGKIELINQKGAEILGCSQSELVGKDWFELFVPDETRLERKERYRLIMEGKMLLMEDEENVIKIRSGEKRVISWHSTLVKDDEGKTIGLLASGMDVTREKKLREELEREKNHFKELFENNLAGVYVSDLEGNLLDCNQSLADIFGYDTPEEMKKYNTEKFYFSPKDRKAFLEKLKREGRLSSFEYILKKKDGTPLWVIENVMLKDGRLHGTLIDVTRMKEFEEELIEMNEAKDKFFSIVSHDIRSPFMALLGYTQLLESEVDTADRKELKFYVESLSQTANNIFNFIEELLQWARAMSGRIEIQKRKLVLFPEIKNVVLLNKERAAQKGIKIVNNVDERLVAFTDENVFNTVLRNLISNSIKFTSAGGVITVFAEERENEIVIGVKDTGVGIPEENLKRLFRLDTRITTPGTDKETGTGMGLRICKELLERQNNEIWAESELGKGATFYFSLDKPSSDN
jgi:PAS domain S-box-containing protein